MSMLVTYEQVCDQLRLDSDADEADVTLKIEAASEAVLNYIKDTDSYFDSPGDVVDDNVPAVVKKCVLYLVGVLYADRDGADSSVWADGKLPPAVIALLTPLRDPTMA